MSPAIGVGVGVGVGVGFFVGFGVFVGVAVGVGVSAGVEGSPALGGGDSGAAVTAGSEGSAIEGRRLEPGSGVIGVLMNGVDCGLMLVQATNMAAMEANKASLAARTVSLLMGWSTGAYGSGSATAASASRALRSDR